MLRTLNEKKNRGTRFDTQRSKDFFNKLGKNYVKSAKAEYDRIYSRTASIIEPYLKGKVLNLGSGGIDLPDSRGMTLQVSLDTSEELIKCHKLGEGREAICAEARDLPFEGESFDVIVAHFSLHHFAQESVFLTFEYVREVFRSIKRIIKKRGKVIIAENTVNDAVAFFEKLGYPALRSILSRSKRPPVYLFSVRTLNAFLKEAGFRLLNFTSFKEEAKPLLLPFSIPRSVNPMSISVFIGEKQ